MPVTKTTYTQGEIRSLIADHVGVNVSDVRLVISRGYTSSDPRERDVAPSVSAEVTHGGDPVIGGGQ